MLGRFPEARSWRRLFAAFSVSSLGDEFTRIALLAKVYELGGSIADLTTLVLAQAIPSILLAPLVGTLSDRGNKREYLIVSDAARCVLAVLCALTQSVAQTIVVAVALSGFKSIFRPVEASLEADLVSEEEIQDVNAIRMGTRQVLMIAGPLAVGAFLSVFSARAALLVDAATFGLSALILLAIPRTVGRRDAAAQAGLAKGVREGLGFIVRDEGLRLLLIAHVVVVLLLGVQGPLLFDFVATRFGDVGSNYGILMTGLGVGAVAGALLLKRWPSLSGRGLFVLYVVMGIDGLALAGFTYGRTIFACTAAMVLMGLISTTFQIISRSYLQTRPPAPLRGRVLGWFEGIQGPLSVASLGLVLWLVQLASAAVILRAAAVLELTAAFVSLAVLVVMQRGRGR